VYSTTHTLSVTFGIDRSKFLVSSCTYGSFSFILGFPTPAQVVSLSIFKLASQAQLLHVNSLFNATFDVGI
jgi:hypothetical protein